jgi:hypothetical protein
MTTVGGAMRQFCPCGRRLHYPNLRSRLYMARQFRRFGTTILVSTSAGTWRVPRQYLALHGGFRPWEFPKLARRFGWRQTSRHRPFRLHGLVVAHM